MGLEMTHEIALQKLAQLEAVLASMTGSAGVGELSGEQITALLDTCHALAFESLQGFAI